MAKTYRLARGSSQSEVKQLKGKISRYTKKYLNVIKKDDMPEPLRRYLRDFRILLIGSFIVLVIAFFLFLIKALINWELSASYISILGILSLIVVLLLGFYVATKYEFINGRYIIFKGVVTNIAYKNKKKEKEMQYFIIKNESNQYIKVKTYKTKMEFQEGMNVAVYTSQKGYLDTSGVYLINNYYTISVL